MAASDGPSESKKKSTRKMNNICGVCGDGALINNYGAMSCFSCRTFFRRNAFPNKELPVCRLDGLCGITKLTRKACTACRLAKCLSVGMSPELIRREDQSIARRRSTTPKKEEPTEPITTAVTTTQAFSIPSSVIPKSSDLSVSDQILISNIIHAFDTFSPVPEIRDAIDLLNISPSDFQFDISQSLCVMSIFCNSLQSFIGSIPDFKILTSVEQCSLFQRNMLGLLSLGGMYLMRASGVFDKPENEMILLPLYDPEVMKRAKVICQQMDDDPIPFKIMLVALAFSSNYYMLNDDGNINKDSLLLGTFRLFGSQNVYLELVWKYLIQTYGDYVTVQKFSTLVKHPLDTMTFAIDLYENNLIHQAFIDNIIEEMSNASLINEKATVPLWGRKYE